LAGGIEALVIALVRHIGGNLLDDFARSRLVEAEPPASPSRRRIMRWIAIARFVSSTMRFR